MSPVRSEAELRRNDIAGEDGFCDCCGDETWVVNFPGNEQDDFRVCVECLGRALEIASGVG